MFSGQYHEGSTSKTEKKIQVLVVSYDPFPQTLLDGLHERFESFCIETLFVSSGEDALSLLCSGLCSFDLILLEMEAPILTPQAMLELRSLNVRVDDPVCLLVDHVPSMIVAQEMKDLCSSSYEGFLAEFSSPESAKAFLDKCGACDVLNKPVSLGKLTNLFQKVIWRLFHVLSLPPPSAAGRNSVQWKEGHSSKTGGNVIKIRILVVSNDDFSQMVLDCLKNNFDMLSIEIMFLDSGADVVSLLCLGLLNFDLIIMEMETHLLTPQAIQELRDLEFTDDDLVRLLTDVKHMNGVQGMRKLHSFGYDGIIAGVSSLDWECGKAFLLESGIFEVLKKPVSDDMLRDFFQRVIWSVFGDFYLPPPSGSDFWDEIVMIDPTEDKKDADHD